MAKKESTLSNMVLTLLVTTLLASLALGGIYNLTKEPIALAKKAKQEKAIKEVIPEFDTLFSFKRLPVQGADSLVFYSGYQIEGNDTILVGTAVQTYSNKGYDATQIQLMVGFLPDLTIKNISVVQHKETPGLGTKMAEPKFKDQFMGQHPEEFTLEVRKYDPEGDVDAITAATISSSAFCDAVNRAYQTIAEEGGKAQ
jgi:electron transport complex protein RnfG